jgi:hypothetical protein
LAERIGGESVQGTFLVWAEFHNQS